jgi:hypothetical protein
MSLIVCPECGSEVSDAAVACPTCGRPLRTIPVAKEVVPVRREGTDPKWVIIPIAVIAGVVLLFLFFFMRSGEDDANVNLKVNASRTGSNRDIARSDSTVDSAPSSVSTVPGSSTTVNPPVSSGVNPPSTSTVPGTSTDVGTPQKGTVTVDAKIATRNGSAPVRNARFYLLDKDVDLILTEARVEPIEGQTLMSSLGLAAAFPNRYGDFQRRAMAAIRNHVKASATSSSAGKAEFANVEPNMYYLFAVTSNSEGFALWSSPVTIQAGSNVLNLTPQPLTDVSGFSD